MKSNRLNYERIYAYRFRLTPPESKQRTWGIISRWIYNRFGKPERVIDPAAGALEFAVSVPAREVWAVDLHQPAVATGGNHIKHVRADIFEAELPVGHFDMAFASNFLEHLESPERAQQFLLKMFDTLRPGGRIVIMGPNFRYAYKQYFDCADHRLVLTDIGVQEFLHAAGFEVEVSYSKFLPYSFRNRGPKGAFFVKTYLAWPILWRFFGKQFLVVGIKR